MLTPLCTTLGIEHPILSAAMGGATVPEFPSEAWGEYADQATVMPLNMEAELRRWGAGTPA